MSGGAGRPTRAERRDPTRAARPSAPEPVTGPFAAVYGLVALAEVAGEYLELRELVWLTKPFLMPILLVWVITTVRERPTPIAQALGVALVFSFLGDVFLMIPGDLFTWGLGSFLVAHLAYVFAFTWRPPDQPRPKEIPRGLVALTFPIQMYAVLMLVYLYPHLGDMKLPVLLYMAVIFAMAVTSTFRRDRVPKEAFWPVYSGAIAFVVSDSVIALDRFAEPVPYARVIIMGSYLPAQYWIVQGLLREHAAEGASGAS